jgi:hypothetical protein
MLKKWDEEFDRDTVEVILNHETVEGVSEAFLEGKVNYYSYKRTETALATLP